MNIYKYTILIFTFFIYIFNLNLSANEILKNDSILKNDPYTKKYDKNKKADEAFSINLNPTIIKLNNSNTKNNNSNTKYKNVYIHLPFILDDRNYKQTENILLQELNNTKINRLIIDMRYNQGGTAKYFPRLKYIINKSPNLFFYNQFMNEQSEESLEINTIINNKELNYNNNELNYNELNISKNYNQLIILINQNTASGYELLISSLSNNAIENNITIIGIPSYGKTFVQVDDKLNNKYYTDSIMLSPQNIPLFKIYPDIYYPNIDKLNIKDLNNIQNIIDTNKELPLSIHGTGYKINKDIKLDKFKEEFYNFYKEKQTQGELPEGELPLGGKRASDCEQEFARSIAFNCCCFAPARSIDSTGGGPTPLLLGNNRVQSGKREHSGVDKKYKNINIKI